MAGHDVVNSPASTSLSERDWSVYRCAHGCVHVAVDRVTLTFTDEEFRTFRDLIQRAGPLIGGAVQDPTSDVRAH